MTEILSMSVQIEGKTVTFTAESNNTISHELCAGCNQDHKDAETPYWIFVGRETVCRKCAGKHVPLLLKAVDALNEEHTRKGERAQLERDASFNELQADFMAGQIGDYHELTKACLGLLEQLLPNADAQGEISKIVLEEIYKRLADRKTWIFHMTEDRARMEEHVATMKRQACERSAGLDEDIPF